jgi:hypothetical protein
LFGFGVEKRKVTGAGDLSPGTIFIQTLPTKLNIKMELEKYQAK